MGTHTRRYVMPLTKELVIGWPETFQFRDKPDETFLATRFYINAPEAGFCLIRHFYSYQTGEFCHEDWPMISLAEFPTHSKPVDPFAWMGRGSRRAKIYPLWISSTDPDLRLKVEYTGLIPKGMRAGDSFRLCAMLIGQEEANGEY